MAGPRTSMILLACTLLAGSVPAIAQGPIERDMPRPYGGPRIDPNTGYRYYEPHPYRPRFGERLPPAYWRRSMPEPWYSRPKQHFSRRWFSCQKYPYRCPGPP
jgi:hypothetical protein